MILGRMGLLRPEDNLCGCPLSCDMNTFQWYRHSQPFAALCWLATVEFFCIISLLCKLYLECLDFDRFPLLYSLTEISIECL